MKIAQITMLLLWVLTLASCSSDFEQEVDRVSPGTGQVTFLFGLQKNDVLAVQSRGSEPERITHMWYAVADKEGKIIKPLYQKLENDFSKLTIEGLEQGDYTLVFLATTSTEENAMETVNTPTLLSDDWLMSSTEKMPLDALYFYKKIELHIDREQNGVSELVTLERCVGRVDIDLKLSSEYMWRFIRKIDVTFDDTEGIYTTLNADGQYIGGKEVVSYDITEKCSFYSLPSKDALSGFVTIESERSDGKLFERKYRFTNCKIEAGRVTHISIDYLHPENQEGFLYVREKDFERFQTDTMFLADEPRAIFYNSERRSFYANAPLQLSISNEHKLLVKFFSPVSIQNVTVMCRFNKISTEFFKLAHFEQIYPFMEASFPLPVVDSERTFTTSNGRKVAVPAQPELSNDDVTLVIQTDDPFIKKMEQIDSHWFIRFSSYSADAGHAYWRHMNPLLCRHGVALAINMAFMFSSEEFNTEMNTYEGKLKDNGGNPINLDVLRQKIRNHGGLVLGCVSGVGGLGGGTTYGLANYCYTGVYFDATPPNAHPHNYPRQAMFHEYGHCLGYNHNSTMTYGDQWTVLCATVFVNMGKEGKLPVCSKEIIVQLPM